MDRVVFFLGAGFISLLGTAEMSFSWNIEWATLGGIYQSQKSPRKLKHAVSGARPLSFLL